jgi:hypothetical protein
MDKEQTAPSACRHCGIGAREHLQRWTQGVGWHRHEPPTQEQIKQRMQARGAAEATA